MSAVTDKLIPDRGFLAEWVKLYTPMGEAPAEAHLATALALASAAVGWRAYVQWGEMVEPCCMTVLLEGGSATARKTTTAAAARRVAQMAVHDAVDAPGLQVRPMAHTSDRGIYEAIGTTEADVAKRWEREPPPGHLWIWDEFGATLGSPGDIKGADWLGRVRATLMILTGGHHGGIQTGQTKIKPSRCSVSVLGTMTRAELEQRMSLSLVEDGFIGRVALVPVGARRAYLAVPPRWSSADTDRRERLVAWVKDLVTSPDVMGEIFEHHTRAALALRTAWYEERTADFDRRVERSRNELDRARVTLHGRLQAVAVKLAAIGALAEREPGEPLHAVQIHERHVEWGIWFAEYALEEFMEILGGGVGTPADRYAEKVLAFMAALNGQGTIGRKELLDAIRMDGMSRSHRWAVIEGLHQDGSVVIDTVKTGGRPKVVVSRG